MTLLDTFGGGAWLRGAGQAIDYFGNLLGNPLPEFNISERLQGFPVKTVSAAEPQVQGATTTNQSTVNQTLNQTSPTTTTSSGSDGGGGGNVSGQPAEDPNAALWRELDNIYNEAVGRLQEKKQNISAQLQPALQDVEGQFQAGLGSLTSEKQIGERQADAAGVEAGQTRENALVAGRRLLNELAMGGKQKFGALSSAGKAYGELAGREFQRGQATAYQSYQNAINKITDIKSNIQTRFASAKQNLEAQKATAINQIQAEFRNKLDQVDDMILAAGQNRSDARLDLLSQLRNQVYNLNLAFAQTEAALKQQLQEQTAMVSKYEQLIGDSASQGNQINQQLGANTLYPQTDLSFSQSPELASTMTGQISPTRKPEEEFYV